MSNQLVCDKCQKAIDTSQPYYTLTLTKVSVKSATPSSPGVTTTVEPTKSYDFHENHVPKVIDPVTPAPPTG